MIIECKQCGSKFKLDEGMLREEGSKVRCSVCKATFMAYPPSSSAMDNGMQKPLSQSQQETVTLDTPPPPGKQTGEPLLGDTFEKELSKALQEDEATEKAESPSPDQLLEEEEEDLRFDFEEATKPIPERAFEPSPALAAQADQTPPSPEKSGKSDIRKSKRRGLSRFLTILLILVLILIAGASGLYFFAPKYLPGSLTSLLGVGPKPEVKDPGIARLSFKAVTGKFCPSNKAGNLFCVQGMIVNGYPGSRSFIRVKGSLLDEKGVTVKQKLAFAGNFHPENELKDMSLDQIGQAMANRTGKGNMNVNVKPQASVPFMIVFESLPDNLSEFTVEAVSSAPGQ